MYYEVITAVNDDIWHVYAHRSVTTWQRAPKITWQRDQHTPAWDQWRHAARRQEQRDFEHTAVRFSYKAQAIVEHCAVSTADVVVWLDADVKQLQPCDDLAWMCLMPTPSHCVTWLDRSPVKYAETGWLAINLAHPRTRDLLAEFADFYLSDRLWNLSQWHDAYIFTHVVKSGAYPARNLLHNPRSSEPFEASDLAPWFRHYKGQRKRMI